MVRMITNVDKHLNNTFDNLEQKHRDNEDIAEQMFQIMENQHDNHAELVD